jgi:hypothetical protein
MEWFAMHKHSSLLITFVNYGRKKFYNNVTWLGYSPSVNQEVKVIKHFFSLSLTAPKNKLERLSSYKNLRVRPELIRAPHRAPF